MWSHTPSFYHWVVVKHLTNASHIGILAMFLEKCIHIRTGQVSIGHNTWKKETTWFKTLQIMTKQNITDIDKPLYTSTRENFAAAKHFSVMHKLHLLCSSVEARSQYRAWYGASIRIRTGHQTHSIVCNGQKKTERRHVQVPKRCLLIQKKTTRTHTQWHTIPEYDAGTQVTFWRRTVRA